MRMFRMMASAFVGFSISGFITLVSTLVLVALSLIAWRQPSSAEIMAVQNQTQSARKPAAPSKPDSALGTMYPTTPNVGSPEWQKEERDNERKDQHLKAIMGGICKGC